MPHDPVGLSYAVTAGALAVIAHVTWRRRAHNPVLAGSLVVAMLALGVVSVADAVAVSSANEMTAAVASLVILPACRWPRARSDASNSSASFGRGPRPAG